jgi:hypothetical protein
MENRKKGIIKPEITGVVLDPDKYYCCDYILQWVDQSAHVETWADRPCKCGAPIQSTDPTCLICEGCLWEERGWL